MNTADIPEKHRRIQNASHTVKRVAELLSGMVGVLESVRAYQHHHWPPVTTFFAFVIALLAVSELMWHWQAAHRSKVIVELIACVVAAVYVALALVSNSPVEVIDIFLIVLGLAAGVEWWLHSTYARNQVRAARDETS